MRAWESVWPARDEVDDVTSSEAETTMPGDDVLLPPLTPLDRCDACRAQAYVRVRLADGGELLFCGHHFREHEARLRPLASDVLDETAKLTEPTPVTEHEA